MQTFNELCGRLAEKDYKITPQRRIIINTLLEHSEVHLSAEDIYGIVKVKHPEIGLATVYRTLDLLAEIGVLQKINFGDGCSRYEFNHGEEQHHHHHLICTNCGAVIEFADDLLEALEEKISQKSGFLIVDHQLKFFGLCKNCRK